MKHIKNIIFDYGNVIFSLNFIKAKQAWLDLGLENPDEFYGHKIQDNIFDDFETGKINAIEFRTHIRSKIKNPKLTDQQIDDAWNSLLVGIVQGNNELVFRVKQKYRTFLLSNINEIHYNFIHKYLKSEFGFENNEHLFEKTYYSHLLGKRKPEANIFQQVLDENNLNPAETLFIDDSPQHIAGAQQLGIQTYLMTAPDTIQKFFSGWDLGEK